MQPEATAQRNILGSAEGHQERDATDEKGSIQPEKGDYIHLRAVSQGGDELMFKVRRTTPLKKLMDAYCGKMSIGRHQIRFLYDGERVDDSDTAQSLECEDNDILDVGAVFSLPVLCCAAC